ncbi:MAG: cell division protein ZapE [Gallionella sp.]
MSQHDSPIPSDGSISPKVWYLGFSKQPGFIPDTAQEAAIDELDVLWHQLVEFKNKRNNFLGRSLLSPDVPKGLYLWGGVGRGKTFLMDAFYACLPYRRKRRIHFHNFMAEVHHEMKLLADRNDPLIALADDIEKSTRLLCLDEFHVDDIADAMILGRLVTALFERGVVLITTSNYHPDKLYPNGLQRQRFLPAIELLKRELKVLNVEGGSDYRQRDTHREPLFLVAENAEDGDANETNLSAWFEKISSGTLLDEQHIMVHDRTVPVKRLAKNVVWFNFKELCGGTYAHSDYLEIAHHYPTVFLSHIPRMTADNAPEARRFTWLIDVLYDNNVRLVASSEVTPENIYTDGEMSGEFSRTASRLTDMQTQQYLQRPHHTQEIKLSGEG